jgi:recombination protein RecA
MKKARRNSSRTVALMDRVNGQMGSQVLSLASHPRWKVERVPSGSLVIDRITAGGFPRGRHVELFGDYHGGKTTVACMTMVGAQQRGETVALLDSEGSFDERYFEHLGGNLGELLIHRPKTAEEFIKIMQLLVIADAEEDIHPADVVMVDSVASLLPQEELKKDVEEGDDRTAGRARMMSRALRRITAQNDHTLILWTNQLIDKVSGYGGTTTPGGRALKHYASVRIEFKKLDRMKKGRKRVKRAKVQTVDVPVGHWVAVRAEKQKTARPELESMFLYDYERSLIDAEYEIIHLGLEDKLIVRSGNTFTYEDSDGQEWKGTESVFRKHLRDNDEMREELVWAIQQNSLSISNPESEDDNESD